MFRLFSTLFGLLPAVTMLLLVLPVEAQQFRLAVPGDPAGSSTAVVTPEGLAITDAQGGTFQYVRAPRFDTPDGQYLGFFNAVTQQALRWPATGQGNMQIGDPQGLAWRASQQQVSPVGPAGGPVIRPRPGLPAGGGPMVAGGVGGLGAGQVRPHGLPGGFAGAISHVAAGFDRRGAPQMALIDQGGMVRVYEGSRGNWLYSTEIGGLDLAPGAPLGLTPDITPGLPRVFTVTSGGALVMLTQNQGPVPFAPQILFPAAAPISVNVTDRQSQGFAIDLNGQLWELDLRRQAHRLVDGAAGQFVPGTKVTVLTRPGLQGSLDQSLLLTDARGVLAMYQSAAGTWGPRIDLADGFLPGGPVGAAFLDLPNGNRLMYLAAVDWRGQLQLLTGSPGALQGSVIDTGTLPPGTPVLVHTSLEGVLLSAVGADGVWRVWRPGVSGVWDVATLHAGFPPGAPVIVDPLTGGLLCVDVRGRVVPAHWSDGAWNCRLCHHTLPEPPRLVSRRVIPNQPLPPARVTLLNGGEDELIVQVADAAAPEHSRQVQLPVGGSQTEIFERDAGATVEEVYLAPTPIGGWMEQVATYPLPPQPRYSLAVWANRTTYQYINRNPNKPAGALPDFDLKSHVSLGVLDLPPGELLRDGETIDVNREALRNRNPGAAGYFGLPGGGPEVIPRP